MTDTLEHEREVLEQAVVEAGREILRISRSGFDTSFKSNQDPLTTADLAANQILLDRLTAAFPQDGWLSEESVDDAARLSKARTWIVDPIDGTKEFVRGVPEYAVSVALVKGNRVVLGAVYNPATDELFVAIHECGAFLNGKPIAVKSIVTRPFVVLGSRSDRRSGALDTLRDVIDIRRIGSIAYKLALVACGKADATISVTPKNEWDIAAGVLLVQEAGGFVADKSLHPLIFNQPNTLVSGVVAVSDSAKIEFINTVSKALKGE